MTSDTVRSPARIGPAGWSYSDWSGYVYPVPRPRGFHEAAYLAQFFDTIEINTSFYGPLRPDLARQWIDRVSANPRFVFTAKLWQKFTHEPFAKAGPGPKGSSGPLAQMSMQDEELVRAGFDVLRSAGKLGAVLLQFPFAFHRDSETLRYLSALLDRFSDYPLAVEVRHASWSDPAFFDLLRRHDAAFCNIDQPIIGRSLEPSALATTSYAYFRLHGRRYDTWFSDDPGIPQHERYNYLYSAQELDPWSRRIAEVASSVRETYVVTNNHYLGKAVVNALELIHLLTGNKLTVPEPLRQHYPQLEAIAANPRSTLF
jgi:uncharacterized protein YecE (DUF72 family)